MEIGTLEFVMQSARAVMASLALSYEVETGNSFAEDELKVELSMGEENVRKINVLG